MTDFERLADLLFPAVTAVPAQYEAQYPPRALPEGTRVTRFAPSPTGFLHIGNLFTAYVSKLTAHSTRGVFYVRIEDTDKKREVEDGISGILDALKHFGVTPDEGVTGFDEEHGAYGPYKQSARRDIYQCFAKDLVRNGLAYPCFCSESELDALRDTQEAQGVNKGYYSTWARCRDLPYEECARAVEAGQPFLLRLRSDGDEQRRVAFEDTIKGRIEMPENIMDAVLLKSDGIPTYHFAHAVDDHLMRTTHVVRGDEWIASVPLHIALFKACGFKLPKYAHVSPLMKEDEGGKRKLSKRKDPEAAVSFFAQSGYPTESVLEYLLTLINSNFEDWRRANPDAAREAFPFNLKKMSASGALFDMVKLTDVSKNVIAAMTADEVAQKATAWAQDGDEPLHALLSADEDYARAIFSIDRGGAKPRKDIAKWADVREYAAYFYEDLFEPGDALPGTVTPAQAAEILEAYLGVYSPADDKDAWFARIKALCEPLGYTPNVKEYKANPGAFKGHVGDVSAVIRVAVTARLNTPDLYAIMQLLGEDRVSARLRDAAQRFRTR